jgi:hypothetical protein
VMYKLFVTVASRRRASYPGMSLFSRSERCKIKKATKTRRYNMIVARGRRWELYDKGQGVYGSIHEPFHVYELR